MPENTKLDLMVLGTSGLRHYGGVIDEEFHPKLRGTLGAKVYREMADNSSTIGAIQYIIESLVRQVEWRVEPSEIGDNTSLEWAEFLEQCMSDMDYTFEDFISEVLSFLVYGWSYFEVIYKVRRGETGERTTNSTYADGRIGWRKIALRSQDTLDHWVFEEETQDLKGMVQWDVYAGKTAYLPIEKSILFTTRKYKENPEGRSIYRNSVIDYFYLKRISQIEAIGIERDLTGLPTMEVPLALLHPDADVNSKALRYEFEKMLAEIKNDERAYALIPSETDPEGKPTGYKFRLMSTGGSRQFDTNATKLYYKTNILQSVVAQFLQMGMSGVGSFALASTQTNLFAVALGSFLDTITSTFNKSAVGPLLKLNGCPSDYVPKLVHGDIESPPLAEIGAYIQALASAGQLPEDDAIKRKLLEIGNLPIPAVSEGESMSTNQKAPFKGIEPLRSLTVNNGRID